MGIINEIIHSPDYGAASNVDFNGSAAELNIVAPDGWQMVRVGNEIRFEPVQGDGDVIGRASIEVDRGRVGADRGRVGTAQFVVWEEYSKQARGYVDHHHSADPGLVEGLVQDPGVRNIRYGTDVRVRIIGETPMVVEVLAEQVMEAAMDWSVRERAGEYVAASGGWDELGGAK